MRNNRHVRCLPLLVLLLFCVSAGGCSAGGDGGGSPDASASQAEATGGTVRDNTPQVLTPSADGTVTYTAENVLIDASHTDQGYVMIQYTGTATEKAQLTTPDGQTYTYTLSADGSYDVLPFSCGDGVYTLGVYENVDSDLYALVTQQELTVTLADSFLPFLYPNQYVDFDAGTQTVAKAQALAEGVTSDAAFVTNVFSYIAESISYDNAKAASVESEYLPDVDETLASGTGICFDYAALMAAMLRSQGIPTKLQIGYAGDVYHAWISTYVAEGGWLSTILEFDGTSWTLIDPTYAAAAGGTEAVNGSADNYTTSFTY